MPTPKDSPQRSGSNRHQFERADACLAILVSMVVTLRSAGGASRACHERSIGSFMPKEPENHIRIATPPRRAAPAQRSFCMSGIERKSPRPLLPPNAVDRERLFGKVGMPAGPEGIVYLPFAEACEVTISRQAA